MAWLGKMGAIVIALFSSVLGFHTAPPTAAPTTVVQSHQSPATRADIHTTSTQTTKSPDPTSSVQEHTDAWQSQHASSQNCIEGPTAFVQPLTALANISHITSGSATGDARYTYLWLQGQEAVSLFAPADGVLVKITYKVRTDLPQSMSKPDYDLAFEADCHTTYVINHVTDPISEISATAPVTKPIEIKPGSGVSDTDTRPTQSVHVKAGQRIGTTTGTPAAHNFDFGVFVDGNAVCPYEKFDAPTRSQWLALFGDAPCAVHGGI